jgi:hypothetical protein
MMEKQFKSGKPRWQEEQTTTSSHTMNMPLKVSAWALLVCLVSFSECNITPCLHILVTKEDDFVAFLHVTDQVDATEYSEKVILDPMFYSYDYDSPMGTYLIAHLVDNYHFSWCRINTLALICMIDLST